MTHIEHPFVAAAEPVMGMLTEAGHQAWFVGGCVRNALMGVEVSDIDVTTDALPHTVMELAQAAGLKALPTGIDHGTITVISDGEPYEITTFRQDVDTDGRHATVQFSDNIQEDAARRDFTMNALYADPNGLVSDPIGGLPDLMARRVRFIGDAEARITEDYLRILRFFRFFAVYGDASNGIDPDGLAACAMHTDGLLGLSAERVGSEMKKLLDAQDPSQSLAAMSSCGGLAAILPGASSLMIPVLVHTERNLDLTPDAIRRLTAVGGEDAEKRLRLSKAEAKCLAVLQDEIGSSDDLSVLGYRLGEIMAADAAALRFAALGQEVPEDARQKIAHGAAQIMPVSASDLMPGITGKALGERLKQIEAQWLASGFALSKEELLR